MPDLCQTLLPGPGVYVRVFHWRALRLDLCRFPGVELVPTLQGALPALTAPVDRLDAIRAQAAAYPEGDLAWLLAQFDKAQATVSELGYKLDSAGHEWFETEKERDAARADLATLRRLALDAVTAVGLCPCTDPDGDCAKIRALSDALPPEVDHGLPRRDHRPCLRRPCRQSPPHRVRRLQVYLLHPDRPGAAHVVLERPRAEGLGYGSRR